MAIVPMKALLEAGVHFGHRARRWHPKMKPFIFTERNGVHIIDLQQTISRLDNAYKLVRDTVADSGIVLFVGTKRQAQDIIRKEAERCGMPYVNQRWLGGTLTNFHTIRQRVDYMIQLERQRDEGEFDKLTKKEALKLNRLIAKLERRVGGLRDLHELPQIVYVVDVRRESLAVKEANRLEIPVVAMVDTNCDPDPIDYIIPSNDDAIRAIRLITSIIADAVVEGQSIREAEEAEMEAEFEGPVEVQMPPAEAALAEVTEEPAETLAEGPASGEAVPEAEVVEEVTEAAEEPVEVAEAVPEAASEENLASAEDVAAMVEEVAEERSDEAAE